MDTAIALERANKVDAALPYADQSVRLDPGQVIYQYTLGKLYAKTGRRIEAIRELQACVRLNPQIASPYYLLATTYREMGNVGAANVCKQKLQRLQQVKDQE